MHNMRLFVSEIFKKISETSDDSVKEKILRENDTLALRHILQAQYCEHIKFLLPDGPTPYKKKEVPIGIAETNLFRETRKLYLFVEGGAPTLKQVKREQLWIQMLEALQKDEAELLETVRTKQLESKVGLSKAIVDKVFPGLIRTVNRAITSATVAPQVQVKQESSPKAPSVPGKKGRGRPSNASKAAEKARKDEELKKFLEQ
jgi:hypothetical protein